MCGIFFSLSPHPDVKPSDYLRHALWARGPDCMASHRISLDMQWPLKPATPTKRPLRTHLYFLSTLLSLRGDEFAPQPLTDSSTGCCFAWNGEAWKIGSGNVVGNDTLAIFDLLMKSISSLDTLSVLDDVRDTDFRTAFIHALSNVVGPFSFVFYDAIHQRVFFGRDRLGRRSLMFKRGPLGEVTIASVSDEKDKWIEVRANGFYEFDLKKPSIAREIAQFNAKDSISSYIELHHLPWDGHCLPSSFDDINPTGSWCNTTHSPFPSTLLNRNTKIVKNWRLNQDSKSVLQLNSHLENSLRLRVQNIPKKIPEVLRDTAAPVAILFSGGVDCAVLARIVHDILPQNMEIDLLNVAFENPRAVAAAKAAIKNELDFPMHDPYARCPDRITGLSSYAELQKTCSTRPWRFVSINIPFAEMMTHRDRVISLMYPHNTEMDLSIACALYFAARGQGLVTAKDHVAQVYTTAARVLLSGLGADELFAGYTRHATAFRRHGNIGLLDELDLDIGRLSERNLGRDDRIISHWGKEARYPYLDEDLVKWAVELPLWEKCGFGQGEYFSGGSGVKDPQIEPAKQILRLLAWKLGMPGVAIEKKRAIQFGARTAKMVAGRTKGAEVIN